MFVLHPSSRCDVCLDAFTWETDMAPHAIPCGHVFCKTCLLAVVPPKCPLCRKNYDPGRLKKLHVDRPDVMEDPKEAELLQRVALSFDAPEEHLGQLLTEVETWLHGKHENTGRPLKKAREAINNYQQLKTAGVENKRAITQLQAEIRDYCRQIAAEKDSAEAIEKGLLAGAKELETQLATYKTEIEELRAELHRRTYTKNPLPPPPEPVSLDRYPGFAQAAAAGTDHWYNDRGRSMLTPMKSVANGVSYVHPRNLYPDDERENQALVLHDANGTRRDRKGKGRDNTEPSTDIYRSVYMPASQTHVHTATTNGVHAAIEAPPPKAGIIPGATPSQKFMPPDPETEKERGWNAFKPPDTVLQQQREREDRDASRGFFDPARDAADPWSLTASLLPEYANGWAEGYTAAVQSSHATSGARSKAKTNGHETKAPDTLTSTLLDRPERTNGRERHRDRGRERERPSTSHQATTTSFLPEAISVLSSGQVRPSRAADESTTFSRSRTHRHRASDVDGMNLSQPQTMLASILSDNPSSRRARSRPRTSVDISQSQTLAPVPPQPSIQHVPRPPTQSIPPLVQPLPRPAPQQHSLTFEEPTDQMQTPDSRRSLQSASSWGTVTTGTNPHTSPGSFASLNLRAFTRNPVLTAVPQPYRSPIRPFPHRESSDDEAERAINGRTPRNHAIPAELSAPSRAPPMPSPSRLSEERAHDHATAPSRRVAYPVPPPASASASYGSRHTQAITVTHHYQNPALTQRPPSTNPTDHSQPRGQTRTSSRHHGQTHTRGRRLSSAAASLSMGGTAVPHSAPATGYEWPESDGYQTDAPQSGNALGLALDATEPSGPPPITAPTPVISSRSFLRSFSYDNFTQ